MYLTLKLLACCLTLQIPPQKRARFQKVEALFPRLHTCFRKRHRLLPEILNYNPMGYYFQRGPAPGAVLGRLGGGV